MSEQLNDLDESDLNAFLLDELEPLNGYRQRVRSTTDAHARIRLIAGIASGTYQAGLIYVGLDNSSEAMRCFRESVEARVSLFTSNIAHEDKTPVKLLESIYLTLVVGDWQAAAKLARARRYEVVDYDDGEFVADRAIMGYIVAFQDAVSGDIKQALRLAMENIERNHERKEPFVRTALQETETLTAALQRNEAEFQSALEAIVQQHTREAKKGRLREETEGLLCLKGLALAALGRRLGLPVNSDSPYLPLSLLTP